MHKAAATSAAERQFALRACFWAPVVEASLTIGGLQRTLRWVQRLPRRTTAPDLSIAAGERMVGWAFRAQPWLPGKCLSRALVQYGLHRRDGTAARFVVGVRHGTKQNGAQQRSLDAHAWVEAIASEQDGTAPVAPYEPVLRAEHGP